MQYTIASALLLLTHKTFLKSIFNNKNINNNYRGVQVEGVV